MLENLILAYYAQIRKLGPGPPKIEFQASTVPTPNHARVKRLHVTIVLLKINGIFNNPRTKI